jgi:hypothetical protein
LCIPYAKYLKKKFKDIEIRGEYSWHVYSYLDNLFYDAEHPNGITEKNLLLKLPNWAKGYIYQKII